MLSELLVERVRTIFTHTIDVKVVIMGGKCKEVLAWRISSYFTPLLSILKTSNLAIKIVKITNGNLSHIAAHGQMIVLRGVADCSSLLIRRIDTHRACSHCLDLLLAGRFMIRYCAFTFESAC